jgi:serine/threonine-protein kinase
MPLVPSTRLGPYEILSPLGAGGMGEVYRARDPRMGREVAIKVSAERFSDRFEREVHAVAALNHPNICHIYDVGPNYLVMELIEGATLAERIDSGAIVLEEALSIAHQIGDALEAAHEKGIVHRDLKPANVKLKPDGTVKVLDFGLAKIAEQAAAAGSPEESPTMTMGATIAGQIMGTAAYMAPEQARGKTVDKRADIWAFGVVLYEMLTGRRMFEGETISDVLAGVLTREPDLTCTPAGAQRLLKSCLEKDPKRRLRDIGDAWRLVEDATPAEAGRSATAWKLAAAAMALICAVALWAPWRAAVRTAELVSTHVDLDLGPDVSFGSTTGPAVILSPDGSRIVYVSQGADGVRRLFTRRLDQPKAVQMPGTEGAFAQFFSPDGQWVGFFGKGKLKKTRIDGGEPVALCDAPGPRGASWGDDGNIIAALDQQTGLSLVSVDGGKAEALTNLDLEKGETTHRWPYLLPGSKAALFLCSTAYGHYDEADIEAVTLKDRRRKTLLPHGGMFPRYLATGHLLYVSKGTAFTAAFDPDRLEVTAAPTRLWEVGGNPNLGFGQLDFSRNGTLVYRTGGAEALRTMQWLDTSGKTETLGLEPAYYLMPSVSPDGKRLAYAMSQGTSQDIWTYDLERTIKSRLTSGQNAYPVWSPDGRFLFFQGLGGMWWTRADGSGQPQLLMPSKAVQLPFSFSPTPMRLAYSEQNPGAKSDIRTVVIEDQAGQLQVGQPQVLFSTPVGLTYPTFSPDGRWLAYANAAGAQYEVYVRAFPDNGSLEQVSNSGGVSPKWSRNGHELFYRTEDQRLMVAEYAVKGNSFVPQKPRVWFSRPLANAGLSINFDPAPDGKRVLALMSAESSEPREAQSHVTLVMNFFDEVRRRVGGR